MRLSMNWRNRSSSRVYVFSRLESKPSAVLKSINNSIACWRVLCSGADGLRSLGGLNCSPTFRFAASASFHERALADLRYCLPFALKRRCLLQRQRLENSSPV